jgi:hypothetical protein
MERVYSRTGHGVQRQPMSSPIPGTKPGRSSVPAGWAAVTSMPGNVPTEDGPRTRWIRFAIRCLTTWRRGRPRRGSWASTPIGSASSTRVWTGNWWACRRWPDRSRRSWREGGGVRGTRVTRTCPGGVSPVARSTDSETALQAIRGYGLERTYDSTIQGIPRFSASSRTILPNLPNLLMVSRSNKNSSPSLRRIV